MGGSECVSVPLKIAAGFTSLTDKSVIVIHWLENFGILNPLSTFYRGQLRQKIQAETIQVLAAPPSLEEIKKLYIGPSHHSPDHKGVVSCSS